MENKELEEYKTFAASLIVLAYIIGGIVGFLIAKDIWN